jgi:O-antigen chain-terminating methyltransferase
MHNTGETLRGAVPNGTAVDPIELAALVGELRAELARTRAELIALREKVESPGPVTTGSARFAAIYPAFEDRFRGAETEVRRRLEVYLPRIREAVRPDAGGPRVLDVGPGRGEWLALLAEAGVPAAGVEDNEGMVERLRSRGLAVVHADAVRYLDSVPPGSLDAVTAFHVVEHLDLEVLLALLTAVHRALRPGGLFVAETPNPTNLVMGACNFHLDPTHLVPIPPAQLDFLVGSAGFTELETWALHPKEDVDLSGLTLEGVDAATSATVALALQKALFGPQDYAVLARAGDRDRTCSGPTDE